MAAGNAGREARDGATARAVSTVIGVVLVVAITVVLAAVVATLVTGIGDPGGVGPQTTIDVAVDPDDDEVRLTHRAGDDLNSGRTRIVWEIENATYRSQPVDSGSDLTAQQCAVFTFDGTTSSAGTWTGYPSPGDENITRADELTVTLYDSESNQRIYTDRIGVSEHLAEIGTGAGGDC